MDVFSSIVGKSAKLKNVIASARKIAQTPATVLVTGETGTGKEVLVDAIHNAGPMKLSPFRVLNCAALPESLVESELFGHEKGAFTGAIADRQGMIQAAEGGTLFLDEVDSLPLSIQAKLLRFLENGECRKVGALTNQKVNVRLIAATNSNLREKIRQGEFREDLYFRLNVVRIDLPPLRERKEDIPVLLEHFIQRFSDQHNCETPRVSQSTVRRLQQYSWPGNIRELRNFCERICIFCSCQEVAVDSLPNEMRYMDTEADRQAFLLPEDGLNLEDLEIDLINQALERTQGNRTQSAKLLGISRYALSYRIQKHEIAFDTV